MAERSGAIIIFGSGLERRAGEVMPSFDSESRLTAGAEYWSQTGRKDFLMPTGGSLSGL